MGRPFAKHWQSAERHLALCGYAGKIDAKGSKRLAGTRGVAFEYPTFADLPSEITCPKCRSIISSTAKGRKLLAGKKAVHS